MIGLVLALAATAAEPLAKPFAKPATVQVLFDQAADAVSRGDTVAALSGYDELERRLSAKGKPATLAIVRARRGLLLNDLARTGEAVPPLRYALANLARDNPALAGDRLAVAMALGEIDERALDYPAAIRSYRIAEAEAAEPERRRGAWAALARVTMFDDAPAALALMNRALAVPGADTAKTKAIDAQYRVLRARALLNAGDYPAARRDLTAAIAALGGLSAKVDMADIAARSDMAIAALLAGDKESARKFMAYTGAGTQREVLSPPAGGMDVPACGGEGGLKPDDVAVVQFSIADDGSVSGVAPIYMSRGGPGAVAFARAVSGWAWTPAEAARIRPFFRLAVRVELRCTLAQDRPSVVDLLKPAVADWLADGSSLKRLDSYAMTEDERRDLIRFMLARAEAAHAPPRVVAFFLIHDALYAPGDRYSPAGQRGVIVALAAAAGHASVAEDAPARTAIRLVQADTALGLRDTATARPVLEAIVADDALDGHDPLKVGALLRLASLRAQAGDLPGARAAYERTGLSAQECALVDLQPALVNSNSGSGQFPQEAMQWGFEGWAQSEFDVTATGQTANVRATVSYPPFVFSPASVKVLSGARFTQSYRPEGGLGCGGQHYRVRFGGYK